MTAMGWSLVIDRIMRMNSGFVLPDSTVVVKGCRMPALSNISANQLQQVCHRADDDRGIHQKGNIA
jgi:hypothetical protein